MTVRGRLRGVEPHSPLRIVPVPRFLVNSELLLLPIRSRKNSSLTSFLVSPLTSMVMVFVVSPGLKVSARPAPIIFACAETLRQTVHQGGQPVGATADEGCLSGAGAQWLGHDAVVFVLFAEQMADVVFESGEQLHAALRCAPD